MKKIKMNKYDISLKWIHLLGDLVFFFRYFREKNWKFREYVKVYKQKKTFAVYDPHDLQPFIKEWLLFMFLLAPCYAIKKLRKGGEEDEQ